MHGSVLFYSMILNGRVGKVGKGSWSVEFNNSVSDYFGCKRFRDRVIRYIRTSIGYSKQVYIYIYIYLKSSIYNGLELPIVRVFESRCRIAA